MTDGRLRVRKRRSARIPPLTPTSSSVTDRPPLDCGLAVPSTKSVSVGGAGTPASLDAARCEATLARLISDRHAARSRGLRVRCVGL